MPGDPSALLVGYPPSGGAAPMSGPSGGQSLGFGFTFWLVLIGVALPVFILGGLQFGGFSFVFKHR